MSGPIDRRVSTASDVRTRRACRGCAGSATRARLLIRRRRHSMHRAGAPAAAVGLIRRGAPGRLRRCPCPRSDGPRPSHRPARRRRGAGVAGGPPRAERPRRRRGRWFFHGLVPPGRLLGALGAGHDEDLARLGGYLASTSLARQRGATPLTALAPCAVARDQAARVAAATVVVGGFEKARRRCSARVLPAGHRVHGRRGGDQTELVIQGMSIGVTIRSILLRSELLTSGLIGVLLAVLAMPALAIVAGSTDLAVVVAVSLLLACSVATSVAIALPAAMSRFGRDARSARVAGHRRTGPTVGHPLRRGRQDRAEGVNFFSPGPTQAPAARLGRSPSTSMSSSAPARGASS